MKKRILATITFISIAFLIKAQNLDSFTVSLLKGDYLSIRNKKAYNEAEAKSNKSIIDFALVAAKKDSKQILEWYNMSGKDSVIQKELIGTATLINAISFDREQFDKCKTVADLKRMTGYITTNSLSHFAVIRSSKDYYQRCFIYEKKDGKRGLLFVTELKKGGLRVEVKAE